MANIERAGKQRFSRRQITKRTFQVGSYVNQKQTSTSKKVTTPVNVKKTTKLDKKLKNALETPQGIKDNTYIGDVSVSFLASTPKPGKTQLSRRRPPSPVHKADDSKTSANKKQTPLQKSASRNSLVDQSKTQHTSYNRSKSTNTSHNGSKRADLRTLTSSLKSSYAEGSGPHSKSSKLMPSTSTPLGHLKSVTTKTNTSSDFNSQQRKRKSVEKESNMDIHLDSKRRQKTHQKERSMEQTKSSTSSIDEPVTKKRRKVSTAETSVFIGTKMPSSLVKEKSLISSKVQENNVKVTKSRASRHLTASSEEDIAGGNKENCQQSRNKLDKARKTDKKRETASTSDSDERVSNQRVVVLQDGENRKKSDLMDLDVALSCLTDTLEAQMDECDSQREQTAVRLLEKYLVQDISGKISDMQKVKKLQDKIRKNTQTLKERQATLMSLQQKKAELLSERCGKGDERQSADNMKEINQFLNRMKTMISNLSV